MPYTSIHTGETEQFLTLREVIEKGGIKFRSEQLPRRTDSVGMDSLNSSHWLCIFTYENPQTDKKESFSVEYSMGAAHKGRPEANDVLYSAASDAMFFHINSGIYASFENFCGEFGYESKPGIALEIFNSCLKTGRDMLRVFGHTLFGEVMNLVAEGIEE